MSKAFTKDEGEGSNAPELPLGPPLPAGARNYVTPSGAAALRARLAQAQAALDQARAAGDGPRVQLAQQRLEFLAERNALLEEVQPPASANGPVRFGASVRLEDDEGRERRVQIVGIDETDAGHGRISWTSPLARALLGHLTGDEIRVETPQGSRHLTRSWRLLMSSVGFRGGDAFTKQGLSAPPESLFVICLALLGMPTGCCLQTVDGDAFRTTSAGSTTGTTTRRPPDGGSCDIDGQTFLNGALNPANLAQCCNAKTSPGAWLPLFSQAAIVPLNAGGNDEVSADFDGDGRDDVAIADGAGNVEVFFSESDGGWTSPIIISTGLAGQALRPVAGDLNRDGLQDLVVGAGAGSLFVFLNQGNHRFASGLSFPSPDGCPVDPVRIGDYDGDGWPDVVVGLARAGIGCSAGQVGLFRNLGNGDGELASPSVLPSFGSSQSADLRLGDFNGDGALDIAVADDVDTVAFFLNTGHGFGSPTLNTTLHAARLFCPTIWLPRASRPARMAWLSRRRATSSSPSWVSPARHSPRLGQISR